jgi:predicted transcriptional regulator
MSKDQDKKIMEYHAAVESGDIDQEREQQYKELFKNIQRVLRPIQVNNPYSKFITLPETVFKPRRTIALLRGFIKAIAFYHQYQREVKYTSPSGRTGGAGQPYIEVTIEDIEAGFYYMKDVLFSKSDELTKATREFFEKLKEHTKQNQLSSFKTQDIRKAFRTEPRTIQRYMRELSQYGYIRRINGHKGRTGFEYSITDTEEFNRLKTAIDAHIEEVLKNIKAFIQSQK